MATNTGQVGNYTSPLRSIGARVTFTNGTTSHNFSYNDKLKKIKVEKVGNQSKIFGFGVSQKVIIELLDKDKTINFDPTFYANILFKAGTAGFYDASPDLYIDANETSRDEVSGVLTYTMHDALANAKKYTFADLELVPPYTIKQVASAIATKIGAKSATGTDYAKALFSTSYEKGANYEGNETLNEVLDDIAEATQSVYFMKNAGVLYFKRLDTTGNPVITINKSMYFSLDTGETKTIKQIIGATELGDDVKSTPVSEDGSIVVIKDNAFWENREDIATLVEGAFANVSGLTITPFTCNWRGFPYLEIGDKIALITKDDQTVISYYLSDTIEYDGSLSQQTDWTYNERAYEGTANPTTIGEALNKTFARVDKVNERIDIVAGDVASISVTTEEINQTVRGLADNTGEALEGVNEDIAKLYSEVQTKMTKDDYEIAINDVIEENGVSKIIMKNGYKFTRDGLLIEDVDENGNRVGETATKIDNNGMKVLDSTDTEVLTANAEGVNAKNLHATTYLIIGKNSRFEDWGNRTGCFWIGGA
jgi:uncharacterized protein YoxC